MKTIRVFCKRCGEWYEESVDMSVLSQSHTGVVSLAFDHGDHVLTVFLDSDLSVRGESVADKVKDDNHEPTRKALDYFDRY